MTTISIFRQTVITLLCALILGLATVMPVGAQAYGCGAYGSDNYNENCPTSSTPTTTGSGSGSSSSGGGTTFDTVEEGEKIILNDLPGYSTDEGADLALKAGQVVCFTVEINGVVEEYCVTVKEITADYVTLTFDTTPTFDIKLLVGETKDVDVTGDGEPDITVKLNSIVDGLAYLTFRKFAREGEPIPEKTVSVDKTEATAEESSFWKTVGIVAAILLILLGLFWAFKAWRNRRSDDDIIQP